MSLWHKGKGHGKLTDLPPPLALLPGGEAAGVRVAVHGQVRPVAPEDVRLGGGTLQGQVLLCKEKKKVLVDSETHKDTHWKDHPGSLSGASWCNALPSSLTVVSLWCQADNGWVAVLCYVVCSVLLTAGWERARPGAVLPAVSPVWPGQDVARLAGEGDLLPGVEKDLTAHQATSCRLPWVAALLP